MFIVFYGNLSKYEFEHCTLYFEDSSNVLKYNTSAYGLFSEFKIKDSIILDENQLKYKNYIFKINKENLKPVYWDSISNGVVRRIIYKNNKSDKEYNQMTIIGYPKSVSDSLIKSTDFLMQLIFNKEKG